MSRDELRESIGMVLQDTWLFGGTIADNIGYGADNPTREQIVEAAKAAHADRFVRTLPDGYDTVIDDEGSNVSAGEKQLITIARAFLAEPVILILDEATSSVDTRTEVLIQRAMSSLRRGRTSFVIAHRLSTIRDADAILVMEDGADRRAGHARRAARGRRRLRPAVRGPVRPGPGRGRLTQIGSAQPSDLRGWDAATPQHLGSCADHEGGHTLPPRRSLSGCRPLTSVHDGASLSLAADFEPATLDQWRRLALGVLRKSGAAGADTPPEAVDDLLSTTTYDGIRIAPLYDRRTATASHGHRRDGAGLGRPAAPRRARPVRRSGNAILDDLEGGATSIWLDLRAGGWAADDPADLGAALSKILDGFYLDLAGIVLDAGAGRGRRGGRPPCVRIAADPRHARPPATSGSTRTAGPPGPAHRGGPRPGGGVGPRARPSTRACGRSRSTRRRYHEAGRVGRRRSSASRSPPASPTCAR